jgi:hypothetical protein
MQRLSPYWGTVPKMWSQQQSLLPVPRQENFSCDLAAQVRVLSEEYLSHFSGSEQFLKVITTINRDSRLELPLEFLTHPARLPDYDDAVS